MDLTFVYQVEHHAAFGPLIVLYFFLAGMSAGLFLISSLSTVFGQEKFTPLAKPACAMALATLIPGLLALVIDLGQPLRALTLFFRVNPFSVMSWGSFILLVYGLAVMVYAYYLWREESKVKFWGKVGAVFAVALGSYTGFLLAVVPSHSLWNSALLPILFLISGMVAALSLLSLLQGFIPKVLRLKDDDEDALHGMKIGMVTVEILLVVFHFISVLTTNAAGHAVIINLLSGTKMVSFVLVQVVLGMVLPLIIVLFSKGSVKALGIAGLFSLIGVFALRYNFVFGGEELPNAGTFLYRLEGGSAWISIIVLSVLAGLLILVMPRLLDILMKGSKTTTHIGETI